MTSIHSQPSHSHQMPINKKPEKINSQEMQQKLQDALNQAEQGAEGSTQNIQDIIQKIGGDFTSLPSKLQTRLDRFLNKIDRNDDGHLSRSELKAMADTNNDGYVSRSEKKEMRAKLNEYLKDKAAIDTLDSETSRQVAEAIEFLDEPSLEDFPVPGPIPRPLPRPIIEPPIINWDNDNFIAKYATTFCTRSKRA